MSTSLGEMVVELEAIKAPDSTANFLKYVNDGYYSQTVFHRILKDFAIQGGGFTAVPISSTTTKTGTIYPPIKLETPASTGLSNTRGTLAMARTGVLNSATREFFINTVDNLALNTNGGGYAVFGKVISGLETTVEAIRLVTVEANSGGEVSQPVTPPVINWAYQLK
jgi:peptidyl-prolyl cis-trans isomerase A (cyclophilin A)